jgi:protein SCO1
VSGPRLHSRRRLLALASLAALPAAAVEPPPTGWVQPRLPAPALPLQWADGQQRGLRQLLAGQVSALQLMFTGCNGSCPVQGALFAHIAGQLPPLRMQLLSVSIDALGDSAQTLAAWQARFGRHAAWAAGVPRLDDVEPLAAYLRGLAGSPGAHTAQVFVFDRQARLAYRTGDDPKPQLVLDLLNHLALNG